MTGFCCQKTGRACVQHVAEASKLATSMTQQVQSQMFDNGHMVLRDAVLIPEAIEKVFLQTVLQNGT